MPYTKGEKFSTELPFSGSAYKTENSNAHFLTTMKTQKIKITFITAGLLICTSLFSAKAQDDVHALHAMFIHNFIKYTEWPNQGQMVVVGVLNSTSATQVLAQRIGSSNSKVQVRNLKSADEAGTCQVVYIPTNSRGQLAKVLELAKGRNILVVTEDSDLVKRGAGISFKVVEEKMKFQVNQGVIKSSGLKVSGSLLALAVE